MFENNLTKLETVEGVVFKFRMPTVSDKVKIESMKSIMTRGQYQFMMISMNERTTRAVLLADAIATLSLCAIVIEPKGEDIIWENLPEEKEGFILDVYEKYQEWRQSFRGKVSKGTEQEGQG